MMTSVSGDDRTYIHYSYKSILCHPIERIRGLWGGSRQLPIHSPPNITYSTEWVDCGVG